MIYQDLKKLAKDLVDGKVFLSSDPKEIQMCFMVLLFADSKDIPPDLAAVYEYYSEAGPMACNGKPMFMSARLLVKNDMDQLRLLVDQYKEMVNGWA